MADVDTTQLSQEHGSIRHDIAVESARLGAQIGAEACGIRAGQGDIRREGAEHTADIRYDLATRAGDIRELIGKTACDTDSKVLERAGDIRREVATVGDNLNDSIRVEGGQTRAQSAAETNEIVKEGLKGDFNTRGDIKDSRFDINSRITNSTDRVVDRLTDHDLKVSERFFTVGRDLMDLRQGQATLAKDVELQALKTQLDAKENTRYLSDKIVADGEKTRALINDLKYHDLNRGLVERNTELVNCEQDRRHHRDRYHDARWEQVQAGFQGQWAQLQSQIQAFQSQLQETRQGMVNFGTMAGVGQSSTSNNVR